MKREDILKSSWVVELTRRYSLSDACMDEFIDSFELLNGGNDVYPEHLAEFVNKESVVENIFTIEDCKKNISKISLMVTGKSMGHLDLKTYLAYIIPTCKSKSNDNSGMREFFDSIDINNDGHIGYGELMLVLSNLKKKKRFENKKKYQRKIEELCQGIDANGDGKITFLEFKNFVNSVQDTTFAENIRKATIKRKYLQDI